MTSEKYIKITGYKGWIGSRITKEIDYEKPTHIH